MIIFYWLAIGNAAWADCFSDILESYRFCQQGQMRLVMTEENSVKKQEEIVEYDILRIGVTFLVVLGHCAYYVIATPYGGMDYSPFISHDGMSKVYAIAVFVVSQIYLFHMELYFTLSGALFYHSYRVRGGVQAI